MHRWSLFLSQFTQQGCISAWRSGFCLIC
jgi:hypothetical protein